MDRERKPQKKHTAVRVDDGTLARLEQIRPQLSTEWRDATMSDILRAALAEGLTILEREHRGQHPRARARVR
jgi:hypothetical protein